MVAKGELPGLMHLDRGLMDRMRGLMEDCWEHSPRNRPDASQIVARVSQGLNLDLRPSGDWGEISSSHFWVSGYTGLSKQSGDLMRSVPSDRSTIWDEGSSAEWETDVRLAQLLCDREPTGSGTTTTTDLIKRLGFVFSNVECYKRFLRCKEERAQSLLDAFQLVCCAFSFPRACYHLLYE